MAKHKPESTIGTQIPDEGISFDVDAFDNLLRSQGVTFIHWRAMRCPVGLVDEHDVRRPHEDHEGCSNGFLYTPAGEVTALFAGNSTKTTATETGLIDGSTVSVTLPRFYDDKEGLPVSVVTFDRLYLKEESILVPHWQLVTQDLSGRDKLQFLAREVQDVVDSRGKRYHPGDYHLEAGRIIWGSNRPGVDPETGKGIVYAIRYLYRPYWYVQHLIHEVRVSQSENIYTGARQIQRMPQACVLQREYVFEKADRDALAKDKDRQVQGPEIQFGPR